MKTFLKQLCLIWIVMSATLASLPSLVMAQQASGTENLAGITKLVRDSSTSPQLEEQIELVLNPIESSSWMFPFAFVRSFTEVDRGPLTVNGMVLTNPGPTSDGGYYIRTPVRSLNAAEIASLSKVLESSSQNPVFFSDKSGDIAVTQQFVAFPNWTQWSVTNHTHWSWNGKQVTSVRGWTEVYCTIFWSVSDVNWQAWWNDSAHTSAFTDGSAHFQYFTTPWGPIQNVWPHAQLDVYGNGDWKAIH